MHTLDWTLIQTFLAVAEHGSFSAAARKTATSQPTVGRHIQALEQQLGTTLFLREIRGHRLTDAGARLLEPARAMQAAAARLDLLAAGHPETLTGVVRITASVVVSHYLLPPVLAAIRVAEPDIELELNPSDDTDNLLFREADIAVRMYRPEQLDVITRKIGALRLGIYAAHGYLALKGVPNSIQDMPAHDFIGYDRSDLMIRGMRAMGIEVNRTYFSTRCDNQTVYQELVRAGCGLGVIPINVAARDPGLARVLPDLAIPDLPIWLTAHEALHNSPRIRRVYDMLANGLSRAAGD